MRRTMSATPRGQPLSRVLVGFIAGAALQLQQPALLAGWVYAALLVLALAGGVAIWRLHGTIALPGSGAALVVLALVVGFGLTGLRAVSFQAGALAPALEGQDIEVTGRVLAMPQRSDDGLRFRLAVDTARRDGQLVTLPAQIYLGWHAGFGGVVASPVDPENPDAPASLLALQRQPQALRAGETWRMTVRLKAPHGNSNPHGFDYELWLWEQGLQATGYVRAGPHDAPPRQLAAGWRHSVERARQSVRDAVLARVADRQLAGVVAALLVGDQNAIERVVR